MDLPSIYQPFLDSTVQLSVVFFSFLGISEFLGGISFPIFVVHGPLGQLFYKKARYDQPKPTPATPGEFMGRIPWWIYGESMDNNG